jgi:hypothetical protein
MHLVFPAKAGTHGSMGTGLRRCDELGDLAGNWGGQC